MLLLIDIGNTTVAIKEIDKDGDFVGSFRFPTCESEDYASLFRRIDLLEKVNACLISSVVPSVSELVFEAVRCVFDIKPRLLKREDIPMPVRVDEPQKVGMDRLVEAYYVYKNYSLPAVTVDLGTATTLGVITAEGFIGGSISAGINTSLDAIGNKGAQLFTVEPFAPTSVIGKNTSECLNIGAVCGAAAMVDGMVNLISKELGARVTVVITGGNSGLVKNLLSTEVVFDENLIFNGLKELYFA